MPYITKDERRRYDPLIDQITKELLEKFPGENGRDFSEGDLNYIISSVVWKLFKKKPSYRMLNKLVGVLESVKLEFYRRQGVPYERVKRRENGDI